jgi:pimeloyl-ACP methyl ester carboxylesterase
MLLDICLNIEIHPESEAEIMQNRSHPRVILAGLLIVCGCNQQKPPAAAPSASSIATPAASAPATTETAQTQEPSAVSAPQAQPGAALTPAGPEGQAQQFIDTLAAGDFEKATADFDETMKRVMPAAKLKEMWDQLATQAGKFQKRRDSRLEQAKVKDVEYQFAWITCEFDKTALDAKVVFTKDGQITGLSFVPAKPKFVGKEELWLGTLDAGGVKLRLLVHIGKSADGVHRATLDSLDQGQKGIPFDEVTYQDGNVRLEAKALKFVFEGKIDETGKTISGQWRQGGATFSLTLQQVDSEPQVRRPQTPQRPFPYRALEVAYENKPAGVRLAGTLTVPESEGPHAAAILITGSGAQDRDETIFGHKPFLVLADYLTRRGIAVLRADDRGVGGSTAAAVEGTTADLAGDVRAGIEFLKGRPEIDPVRIGLIGHSEGGVIAPLVASQSSDVAFIVMLAGSTVTGEEVLYQQAAALLKAAGASEKVIAAERELQSRMFAIVKATPDPQAAEQKINDQVAEFVDSLDDETRKGLGEVKAIAAAQARRVAGNWFRFLLTYDPRPSLEKTRCPVLALNGEKDLQVLPKENLAIIRDALTAGGNRDFEVHELPGLNHLFQTSDTGQVAEYGQIEETFAKSALELIGDWIRRHVDKTAG